MAFISVICPNCGGQSQIEAGRSAMCPYCGAETGPANQSGIAVASQDVQFAQVSQPVSLEKQQAVQFVQPEQTYAPVQQPVQNTAGFIDPQMLAEAKSKRKRWVYLTMLIGLVQAIPVFLYAMGYEYYSIFNRISYFIDDDSLILLWMLLMLIGTGVATGLRPDNAYIEKKPFPKNRFALFVLLGIILGIGSMVWGAFAGTIFGEIISSLGLY